MSKLTVVLVGVGVMVFSVGCGARSASVRAPSEVSADGTTTARLDAAVQAHALDARVLPGDFEVVWNAPAKASPAVSLSTTGLVVHAECASKRGHLDLGDLSSVVSQ